MSTTTVVELNVREIFRFQDGRTVFVGPIEQEAKYIPSGSAEVVVNGQVVAIVELEGEMIPNRRHSLGYRSVSTADVIDLTSISPADADVRLRIHPSKE